MERYSFVDIFATKGIEYLLVIVFLVLFVFFMRALFKGPGDPREDKGHGKAE